MIQSIVLSEKISQNRLRVKSGVEHFIKRKITLDVYSRSNVTIISIKDHSIISFKIYCIKCNRMYMANFQLTFSYSLCQPTPPPPTTTL